MSDQNLPQQYAEIGVVAAQTARDRLLEAFKEQGITTARLAKVADSLLDATTVKTHFSKGRSPIISKEGDVLDPGEEPGFRYSKPLTDNATRLNTLKLITEILDTMPSRKLDINDRRQTRELVNGIMMKLSGMKQLGQDDLKPQLDPVEEELIMDMQRGKDGQYTQELGFEPASMVPSRDPERGE